MRKALPLRQCQQRKHVRKALPLRQWQQQKHGRKALSYSPVAFAKPSQPP